MFLQSKLTFDFGAAGSTTIGWYDARCYPRIKNQIFRTLQHVDEFVVQTLEIMPATGRVRVEAILSITTWYRLSSKMSGNRKNADTWSTLRRKDSWLSGFSNAFRFSHKSAISALDILGPPTNIWKRIESLGFSYATRKSDMTRDAMRLTTPITSVLT